MKTKAIRPLSNNLISKLLYNKYLHNLKCKFYYKFRYSLALNHIKGKKRLRILFFIQNISMWKYEGLCDLLKQDARYEFVIVPFLLPFDSSETQKQIQRNIELYCGRKNYPYIQGIDIDAGTYIPASEFNVDIVAYTQPYNSGYHFWLAEKFWKNSLFIYTPYGLNESNNYKEFLFTILQNIAYANFISSSAFLPMYTQNKLTKGKNVIVTGHPLYEEFKEKENILSKSAKSLRKQIIWAPHHSITPGDIMNRATFLDYAEEMLRITEEFSNVDFIFRPHPYLKRTLYNIWGKEKTDSYYELWNHDNRIINESGNYIDLFLESDGMIHDCCGFMFDYLYAHKPVMFLYKQGVEDTLNPFCIEVMNAHYIGKSSGDIRNFIQNAIIDGQDSKNSVRDKIVDYKLTPPNGNSVAENMKTELDKLFAL